MSVHVARRIHGHPDADAISVIDGRIDRIGTADELPGDRVDHGTAVMLPGLADAHLHPFGMAAAGVQVDLADVRSIPEAVDRLAGRLASSPGALVAVGLDDELLTEGRLPTASDLDALGERPVLVYRHCSHVAVANHAALDLAGIGRHTADPTGGRIVRDASGRPIGILEESAIGLVSTPITKLVPAPDTASIETVLSGLLRRGIVEVNAMVAVPGSMWCSGADEVSALAAVSTPLTVTASVIADDPDSLRRAIDDLAGTAVRFVGWKGFADGSLGGRTAALREPYSDDPSTTGMIVGRDLLAMAEYSVANGGRASIHAIGDRATDEALDIAARLGPGTVRIEHASVADPDQVARMAETGAVASVQPSFARSDGPWLERRLGPVRAGWAYPFRTMLAAGVRVHAGSDAPIESPDPWIGMADAVMERSEGVDLDTAIDLYAAAPIAIGEPATFVIVAPDPRTVGPTATEVIEVWIEGRRVV